MFLKKNFCVVLRIEFLIYFTGAFFLNLIFKLKQFSEKHVKNYMKLMSAREFVC